MRFWTNWRRLHNLSRSNTPPLWRQPRGGVFACMLILAVMFASCVPTVPQSPAAAPSPSPQPPTFTPLPPTFTPAPLATVTVTLTATPQYTPTITNTPEPWGCLRPPDDYERVEVNGVTLNARTLAMLRHAQELYGGELEITGYHITQGSYHPGVDASFGTHDGGGAVDISVIRRGTWTVLWDDIPPLVAALRAAGFAAWLREYGELYPDSPLHIHAVAIGDAELSPAASAQLDGKFGYFRGYTGVPVESGVPVPDRHGGPVLCGWMLEQGYQDLRQQEQR
jgi:hypothetical protein